MTAGLAIVCGGGQLRVGLEILASTSLRLNGSSDCLRCLRFHLNNLPSSVSISSLWFHAYYVTFGKTWQFLCISVVVAGLNFLPF